MGKASQRRGRAGELELARILQGYSYDVQSGRAQNYGEVSDLPGLPGVHIECKCNEQLSVPEVTAQAARNAERFQDGASIVFHRRNHSGWLVTQRLEGQMEIHKNSHIKKEKQAVNETIIQIIPAPSNLMYTYNGKAAQPVAYLAPVELVDGDREIRAMGLTSDEVFEEQPGATLFFESDANQQRSRPSE